MFGRPILKAIAQIAGHASVRTTAVYV